MILLPWMDHWMPGASREEIRRQRISVESGELDFSEIPTGAESEFLRQAELCLQGTIQVAIAADARATTLTGIFGAGTVALLVLAGNLASKEVVPIPLTAAVITGAAVLMFASACCAAAARPIHFDVVGYQPKVLYCAASSERHIKLEAASDIQLRIESNSWALERAAQALSISRWIAISAPLAALTIFCLLYH